jgi:hypothetical protein
MDINEPLVLAGGSLFLHLCVWSMNVHVQDCIGADKSVNMGKRRRLSRSGVHLSVLNFILTNWRIDHV